MLLSTRLQGQGRQSGSNMTKRGYSPEAKRNRKWRSPETGRINRGQRHKTQQRREREKVFRQYPHIHSYREYNNLICHRETVLKAIADIKKVKRDD